jgi:hypothetical protein
VLARSGTIDAMCVAKQASTRRFTAAALSQVIMAGGEGRQQKHKFCAATQRSRTQAWYVRPDLATQFQSIFKTDGEYILLLPSKNDAILEYYSVKLHYI